jgi:hypothetical protein
VQFSRAWSNLLTGLWADVDTDRGQWWGLTSGVRWRGARTTVSEFLTATMITNHHCIYRASALSQQTIFSSRHIVVHSASPARVLIIPEAVEESLETRRHSHPSAQIHTESRLSNNFSDDINQSLNGAAAECWKDARAANPKPFIPPTLAIFEDWVLLNAQVEIRAV